MLGISWLSNAVLAFRNESVPLSYMRYKIAPFWMHSLCIGISIRAFERQDSWNILFWIRSWLKFW